MIIDAENQIAGRLAAYVAKQALLGEKISIVNCEKAVMTGNRQVIMARFKQKRELGAPLTGPYFPKKPEMIIKRIIRGMLPYKKEKGEKAFKNIRCYSGFPDDIKGEAKKVSGADISKVPNLNYVTIEDIARQIGAKI
ncbi:50S ribosomal protein L13 [Candidatus Woesearchaeota archaeon]|nr:50S ribosomal protein L13 [Candidatus Woesearchaeota archaeon]